MTSEEGSFQPGTEEALIERDAVKVSGATIGDTLQISLPDGRMTELTLTGIVADIGLHPATAHDTVYAYVSMETLADMGLQRNQIDFLVAGDPYDRDQILTIGSDYISMLRENGYVVSDLAVSDTPGVSMHLEEYESALFLLQVFSFVTFLFGCLIMSSLITSLLSSQTRQIGVLKGIGASTGKITGAYLLAFFMVITFTTAVSVSLSALLAGSLSAALMRIGNMLPADTSLPAYLYVVYCSLALLIPLLLAFFPIRRGVRISVKDALNDYGVRADEQSLKLPEPKWLARPVLFSLRNALRRKKRFMLNVAILSIAGAMFVSVVTSMISLQTTLSQNLDSWKFDYHYLTPAVDADAELDKLMASVRQVTNYEHWGSSRGMLLYENGEAIGSYPIVSPPKDSRMIEPELMDGRWLTNKDTNQIVISHQFFAASPKTQMGDVLTMQIGNQVQEFVIVGALKDFGATTIYMSENGYQQYVPAENKLSNIKLSLDMTGRKKAVYQQMEAALKAQGVLILQSQSKADLNAVATGHYAVTLQTFLFVICMLVVVAGFGLAATMNLQTAERTKEIGIMKAMGAAKHQIAKTVTAESILISLISWMVSLPLGIPLSILGVFIFGDIILNTPLQFNVFALFAAYVIWLLLTFVIGYRASRACAKHAAQMRLRDSLSFE